MEQNVYRSLQNIQLTYGVMTVSNLWILFYIAVLTVTSVIPFQ